VDFIPANIACSNGPAATFVQRRMVVYVIAITGNLLTLVKNGVRESREITEQETIRLFKDVFELIFRKHVLNRGFLVAFCYEVQTAIFDYRIM
jgi:hypothetical protein